MTEHLVPAAYVISQMRRIVPDHGEISADAVISVQECVSEFITFMTTQANTRCMEEMRTTITGEDLLIAMNRHGFYSYIGPLFVHLNSFREYGGYEHPSLRGELPEIRRSFQTGVMGIGAASEADDDVQGVMALRGFVRDGHNDGPTGSAAEIPAFEVLPSLKRLKQRVIAAGRGQYDAVFMSGSGSTIVGVGSPDPPQFVYDDEEYQDVFLSEASFITREPNQWYREPYATNAGTDSTADFAQSA
ncbi:hypothetical protein POM88_020463 [Heracleum sosnowskyi]|uniref:Transcription factor CBF/NF-Y/archaeal histone domain-containing protein n=1 Tax=Heracleum sosnowskyi TaxID=360622 RepID=A0AAD8MSX0_9APIA|nr:hypothetical protein POM88_020463 [Heracleum sosnowskyi]